jgi:endoplasmic reticulum-Golgi intermediate compartment protein 3
MLSALHKHTFSQIVSGLRSVQVNIVEHKDSFLHFVTNACAIVGGVFTVSGILDATVYHSHRLIQKKIEIGKIG